MLSILVDNNAFEHLLNVDDARLPSRLDDLWQRDILRLHISPLPIIEQIIGISGDKALSEAKKVLTKAFPLAKRGILSDPKRHLSVCVDSPQRNEVVPEAREWIDRIKRVVACNGYSEFEGSPLCGERDNFQQQLEQLRYTPDKDKVHFEQQIANSEKLLKSCLEHFGLCETFTEDQVKRQLPSVLYYRDCAVHHFKKLKNGKTPRTSDYIDLEQVVYLNICDYIVSQDAGLRHTINKCGNSDLKDRAIDFGEFLKMIDEDDKILPRRAPQPCKSIPI